MAKEKTTYSKLVRDKIPDIIKANGEDCHIKILSDDEYAKALTDKLNEELQEFCNSDNDMEELADMLEVIYAIAEHNGTSREKLESIRAKKAEQRGAFKNKIMLLSTSEKTKEERTPETCKTELMNVIIKLLDCLPDSPEYKVILKELMAKWSTLMYILSKNNPENAKIYKAFHSWIPSARNLLDFSYWYEYSNYFSQVLDMIIKYLETNTLDYFIKINPISSASTGMVRYEIITYKLFTKDNCPIQSNALPMVCMTSKLNNTNPEEKLDALKLVYSSHRSEEEVNQMFENWNLNHKPVLDWVNETYVKPNTKG